MKIKLCSECARGNHYECTGLSTTPHEDDASPHPCPCYRCHPPQPGKCTACGRSVNPHTAECAGCSD
ncbi:hypothetical protein [Demequina gelatinilytica]|uniref:hypothetical protein n=1 Tax=Demequina gelatinilytica TaxID=1638980 RepID=UPI000780B031|nr:hypothetical protein [Demequina gelatinilytica]